MDLGLPAEALELQKLCRDFADKEIEPYAESWSEQEHFTFPARQVLRESGA